MDAPFDRMVQSFREVVMSGDLNLLQSQLYRSLIEQATWLTLKRFSDSSQAGGLASGFLVDGLRPVAAANSGGHMNALLVEGLGFYVDATQYQAIDDIQGLDDMQLLKALPLSAPQTIAVDAAPGAGLERYDLIEVAVRRQLTDTQTRGVWTPVGSGGSVAPTTVPKTLAYDLLGQTGRVASGNSTTPIGYKVGTSQAAGTGYNPPATSPGYVAIGALYVPTGLSTLAAANVFDLRPLLFPGGCGRLSGTVSVTNAGVPTLSNVVGPPGVAICCIGGNDPVIGWTMPWFRVAIFGGGGLSALVPTVTAVTPNLSGGLFALVNVTGVANATVTSPYQTAFASGSPNLNVPIGQPYAYFDVQLMGIGAATSFAQMAPPDPMSVNIDVAMRP